MPSFSVNAETVGSATELSQLLVCKVVWANWGDACTADKGREESSAMAVGETAWEWTNRTSSQWTRWTKTSLCVDSFYVSVKSISKSSAAPFWQLEGWRHSVRATISCTYFSFGGAATEKKKKNRGKKSSVWLHKQHAVHNVSNQCADNKIIIMINNNYISSLITGLQTISLPWAVGPESLSQEAVTMATGGIECITWQGWRRCHGCTVNSKSPGTWR